MRPLLSLLSLITGLLDGVLLDLFIEYLGLTLTEQCAPNGHRTIQILSSAFPYLEIGLCNQNNDT